MSRKIAPALDGLVRILEEEGHPLAAPCRAQLRALLACARALETTEHADECPAFGFDEAEDVCKCHRRTLRRLERVSGRGKR